VKALVAHGPGEFRVEDVADPDPGEGAVVEVEAAGVCAADRMIWRGDGPWALAFPFVPGHELLGRVVSVDVESSRRWGVRAGDRVTAEVMVPCGDCHACVSGRTNLCRHGTHLGSGIPGAFAEALALPPQARVHRVPEALPAEAAVLAEPTACALHAVRRAELRAGDVVAVAGIGAIGAAALGVARGRAGTVVAVANSPARAALALELGADAAVDASGDDAAGVILDLTGGRGVDAFVECSGAADAVRLGLEALAPGGRLVLYGVYRQPALVDLNLVAEHKELDVRGGHLAPDAFPEAIELLVGGAVAADRIVTHRHPLHAFGQALGPSPDGSRLKAVLVP
jgi:L-iditol 2-dehydrogenase